MTTNNLDRVWPEDFYEDPDENEWVLPPVPDPDLVPNNTTCHGPFYVWRGEPRSRSWISIGITREITAPWRRGFGVTVRRNRSSARTLGLWWRGPAPRMLSDSPAERDWHKVVKRADQLNGKRERIFQKNLKNRDPISSDSRVDFSQRAAIPTEGGGD